MECRGAPGAQGGRPVGSPQGPPERNASLPAPRFQPGETHVTLGPPKLCGNECVLFYAPEIGDQLQQQSEIQKEQRKTCLYVSTTCRLHDAIIAGVSPGKINSPKQGTLEVCDGQTASVWLLWTSLKGL